MNYLNKYKIIILALFAVFTATSCTEDFLIQPPVSSLNAEEFYQTPQQMEQAVNAIYNSFQEVHIRHWTTYSEVRSDNMDGNSADHLEVDDNQFNENTTSSIWSDLYEIIYRSNVVLDKIAEVQFANEEEANLLRGQAHFFRGWAYFSLVRLFDGVAILDRVFKPSEIPSVPRSSVTETYEQAENDLLQAISLLPSTWSDHEYGRITSFAARGILARLYIQQIGPPLNLDRITQWNLAMPLLSNILNEGTYEMEEEYVTMFTKGGEKSTEMILPVVYSENGLGASNRQYAIQFMAYPIGMFPNVSVEVPFNLMDDADRRKNHNFNENFTTNAGDLVDIVVNNKFAYSYNETLGELGFDFPLLRYTDVLLLHAEGLCELAGELVLPAFSALNKVRARAGLAPISSSDVQDLDSWRTALMNERRLEFLFENIRWWDLVRTNTYVEALQVVGKDADETWRIYPIPLTEIQTHDAGLWKQNPGYQ